MRKMQALKSWIKSRLGQLFSLYFMLNIQRPGYVDRYQIQKLVVFVFFDHFVSDMRPEGRQK